MINEEQFLDMLEQEELDLQPMLSALNELNERGKHGERDAWANLLADTLAERGCLDESMMVMQRLCDWHLDNPAFAEACFKRCSAICSTDRRARLFLEHAGLKKGLPPSECLRRLRLLLALEPGLLCYDKTWGLGVIRRIDPFYKRVEIDFENKSHHFLSFDYAAETLELIDDDHFLAYAHRDPDHLRRMADDNPPELVKMLIRDFGPMAVDSIQEMLSPRILDQDAWKSFWQTARKELKDDPLVDFPARRQEPLSIRDKPKVYDADWFKYLANERDMQTILALLGEFLAGNTDDMLDDKHRAVIADRLRFVITGAGTKKHDLRVGALLTARRFNLSADILDMDKALRNELHPKRLHATVRAINQKNLRQWLNELYDYDTAATHKALTGLLESLPITALTEIIDILMRKGGEQDISNMMRRQLAGKTTNMHVLLWLIRHPNRLSEWNLGKEADVALSLLVSMEKEAAGEDLKAQNQLRERCADPVWLGKVLSDMTPLQRREFTARLRNSPAWPLLERKTVLARIIKLYPELEAVVADEESEGRAVPPPNRYTSFRSYYERQQQLSRITAHDIPRNSRDIAEACAHGDLRENAEYKAAKEMQGLLMKRKADIERELSDITATDFTGFPAEVAGLATCVELSYDNGTKERFYILGEWDRDEELGIISSRSQLAQSLEGHRAGDRIAVPGEKGIQEVLLSAVTPVPEDILSWATQNPAV